MFFLFIIVSTQIGRKITHFIAHTEIYRRLFLFLKEKLWLFALASSKN